MKLKMQSKDKNELLDNETLIQNFKKNLNKKKTIITEVKAKIEQIGKIRDDKIETLRDQIYQLKGQISDLKFNASKEIKDLEESLRDKCAILNKDIEKVSEILYLLRIDRKQKLSWEVFNYNDRYLEEIDTFFSSKTLALKSYIMENDLRNKINKYSLCIVGKTIFNDKFLLEIPHDFLQISLTGINIEKFITKLPTPIELKNYYTRNRERILKNFLQQYAKFEAYYFNVVKKYSISDFLPLAKARCNNCGYFIVELDSHNFYLDNHECPVCFNKSYFKTNEEICK